MIGNLFFFMILSAFVLGVISIIKPLKSLRISTRKRGVAIVFGSVVAFVVLAVVDSAMQSPEEKARFQAARQQAAEEKAAEVKAAAQKQKAQSAEVSQVKKQDQSASLIAASMTQQFRQQGSDVTVNGFDDVLVFDCTKALDPRTACYMIYKQYPSNEGELKVLQLMGIRKLKFQTDGGVFSGYAWTKRIQ